MKTGMLLALALLTGCAERTKECRITGVTITLVPPENVDAYCDVVTGNSLDDAGNFVAPGDKTLGCANKSRREIVASDNDKTLKHEIQHMLNWFCDEPAP